MYTTLLTLHSLFRWVVLLFAVLAVVRSLMRWLQVRDWTPDDDRNAKFYTTTLDIQMLLGLILYVFLSPVTKAAFEDMGAAMSVPSLRFWAVEHITLMIASIAFAHIGRARIRKASSSLARHRLATIFFALSLIAMLAAIPWPGMTNGRPLFRFFN